MNENLRQFLQAAERIAEASGFDGFRLGLVATRQSPSMVVALSAVLEQSAPMSPEVSPPLEVGPVLAFRRSFHLKQLPALIQSLEAGVLGEPLSGLLPAPVHLTPPAVQHQQHWNYRHDAINNDLGRVSQVEASGVEWHKFLGSDLQTLDQQIAEQSDYEYASLERLVRFFTGLRFEHRNYSYIQLLTPWPVRALAAGREGPRLRVELEALHGMDSSRFVLNIEGAQGDKRLDSHNLRWQAVGGAPGGFRTYSTFFDIGESDPLAVNCYVARVPVSLRTEVPRDNPQHILREAWFQPSIGIPLQLDAVESQLTALRLNSFRLLQSADLRLEPSLAVLVGPNQSGKSSVLDALQLLSDAARGRLAEAVVQRRGGFGTLPSRGMRDNTTQLEVELQVAGGPRLRYQLRLSAVGAYDFAVSQEELAEFSQGAWVLVFTRTASQARIAGQAVQVSNEREALLSQPIGLVHPLVQQAQAALASIVVYPYFRTGAAWADPEAIPMRRPARLEPGARLDATGGNLAAALFSMREERPEDWQDYLRIVRLAFPQLKDLRLPAVSRGTVQLFWDEEGGGSFDASELSDGTLSFLAILCAFFQPGHSLVAVDEPEAHLHPDALMRLVGAARSLSERHPILLTTQSDTLIGLLDETPESVVVARREGDRALLVRPTLEALREWLKGYSLRDMRRELEEWGPVS